MASYADQIKAGQAAHLAVNTISHNAQQQILVAFSDWASGQLDAQTIRHRLEAIVRSAYRSSAAVAAEAVSRASELPGWTPAPTFNNDYLQSLLSDVRRNLRNYKVADEDAQRTAVRNIQFSAQVGAQRGYTDQSTEGFTELEDFGYEVLKGWMANFIDNVPCPFCRERHGTIIGLHEEFPAPPKRKVYIDLQGPPGHPRCECQLIMLVRTLENAFETPSFDAPGFVPMMISTDQVKNLPLGLFKSIIAILKSIIAVLRKKK
jgi:hypothetical protein